MLILIGMIGILMSVGMISYCLSQYQATLTLGAALSYHAKSVLWIMGAGSSTGLVIGGGLLLFFKREKKDGKNN